MTTDTLIAGLAGGANDILDAARELARAARLSRTEKVVALALLVMNTVFLAGLTVIIVVLLSNSQTNKATLREVQSCTTPTGACHQQGEAATAKAVGQLARVAILSVECSRVTTTDAAFEKCLETRQAAKP